MPNILISIEYDGTNYHGWQVQANAVTIQQLLQEALTWLLGEEIRLTGAGRTDAGVHARGQAANFRVEHCRVPVERIPFALNPLLPPDIVVKQARQVPDSFHARYDATGKVYSYLVWNGRHHSALFRNYTYHYPVPLDVARMARAACFFCGTHDFRSFAASRGGAKSFTRTIYRAEVTRQSEDLVRFEFEGSGFLYNMVRIMVGTLIEIGAGRRAPEDITRIISAADRGAAGETAPAKGLCLERVNYAVS